MWHLETRSLCMCAKSLQLCLTLCNPTDCSPPVSSVYSPGKNIGVGCHFLLQEIFPTQGSNSTPLMSPASAGRFFTTSTTCEAQQCLYGDNSSSLAIRQRGVGDEAGEIVGTLNVVLRILNLILQKHQIKSMQILDRGVIYIFEKSG